MSTYWVVVACCRWLLTKRVYRTHLLIDIMNIYSWCLCTWCLLTAACWIIISLSLASSGGKGLLAMTTTARLSVCLSHVASQCIPGASPWWHYVHLCINRWLATDMRRLSTVLIGGHTHLTDMILESAARSGAYPSWAIHLLSVRSHVEGVRCGIRWPAHWTHPREHGRNCLNRLQTDL